MEERQELEEIVRALKLVDDVRALQDSACHRCGGAVCAHQVLMSIAIGLKDRPVCAKCLAVELGHPTEDLRDRLSAYLARHRCHRIAWAWANAAERFDVADRRPGCLWPAGTGASLPPSGEAAVAARGGTPAVDVEWDAGGMGCGDLVLELRRRLRGLSAGQVLKLTARDPGAPADLPAWCALTGHRLVVSRHPSYWIQRKES
jgi:tRNA 2-thiouridine synthesizing protein A